MPVQHVLWKIGDRPEQIAEIYRRFKTGSDLTVDFRTHFGDLEDQLNGSHQRHRGCTKRQSDHAVSAKRVPINVLFFRL